MKRVVGTTLSVLMAGSLVIASATTSLAASVTPVVPADVHIIPPDHLTQQNATESVHVKTPLDTTATSVRQLIVKTTNGKLPTAAITKAATAASGGVTATTVRRLPSGMTVLRFAKPLSASSARRVAADLTARSDVAWAQPDHHFVALGASPVADADPYFGQQWDLWDTTYGNPSGGYSIKAPVAWQHERGRSDVVVAILDTGVAPHPELVDALIPTGTSDGTFPVPYGYDFITDPFMAHDNDPVYPVPSRPTVGMPSSRDANPLDAGDWVTADDVANFGTTTDYGCARVEDSSWHGTHLAGTIAAAQNTEGIAGIAPGVKLEPIRVLGRCGGAESDIIDAIEWASGHAVANVPTNTHPAQVINMSLGGPGICSTALQLAIDDARAAGTTVVVAAGNDGTDITAVDQYSGSSPGDCSGVIAVSATGRAGELAQYSNYGTSPGAITIAAPGGDDFGVTGTDNILSTWWNSPTTLANGTHGVYDYAYMAGTSMATPHVAAAVALMQSHVTTPLTPNQVAQRLRETASPFPTGSGCTITRCGAGILNVGAAIPVAPSAPDYIGATPLANDAIHLEWTRPQWGGSPILSYVIELSGDSGQTWQTATASTPTVQSSDMVSTITGLTHGNTYRFRVAAVSQLNQGNPSAYNWATMTSGVTTVTSPLTPNAVDKPTVVGGVEKLTVTWSAPAPGVTPTSYRIFAHRRAASSAWTTIAASLPASARSFTYTTWPASPLASGIYDVRVAALNGSTAGPASVSGTGSVAALVQTATSSATTLRPAKDGFQDTVTFRATSNVPRVGSVRIRNAAGAVVMSWTVPATSSWGVVWSGKNAQGARVANGSYSVEFMRPIRSSTAQLLKKSTLVVTSSQAAIPTITLANETVYPHPDGYLDSIPVKASAVVPSTFVLDIVDKGRVAYHRTYSRRLTLTVPWNGTNDQGATMPVGSYTLRITAQGLDGKPSVKLRKLMVSALRAIPKPFSISFDAAAAMKAASLGVSVVDSNRGVQIDGGDDPATPVDLELNLATFTRALPASIVTPTSVVVRACTTHQDNTAANNAFLGYFSGPADDPSFTSDWAYRVGDATGCYAAKASAPDFAIVKNTLQFWVGNGSLPGNTWTVNSFHVTGYSYYLGA